MCPSIHHRKCHNHRRTNCKVRPFYIYSNGTGSLKFEHYAIIHNIILSSLLLSKTIAETAPTNINYTSKTRIEQYKGATKSELCTSHLYPLLPHLQGWAGCTSHLYPLLPHLQGWAGIVTLHFSEPLFCLFVLVLYVPSQQLWSLRGGQFT